MSNKKQQLALEWFWEQYQAIDLGDTIDRLKVEELINQAKEMHKQEIIDAWEDGQHSFSSRNAEQYYQETFNK